MKRNKNLCVVLIVFLFVLIGVTVKANTSRAMKALRIPAEFITTDENKIWNQCYTMVDIQYGDAKVKLSDSMSVSFDVYAPKKLFSGKNTHLSLYFSLAVHDDNWIWESSVFGKIPSFDIRREGNKYRAYYYDDGKEKSIGKNVKLNNNGKYVKISVDKYPMNSKSVKGRRKKLGLSISLIANAKQDATIYLKNSKISSGNKVVFKSAHDKDDVYTYAMVNQLKLGLLHTDTYNKNKIPKFKKIPDDIRNATSKKYVARTDKKAITNTISDATKKKAKAFEKADYTSLPDWHGTQINNWQTIGWGGFSRSNPCFTEGLIKELAGEGFNFVRVTIDTRIVFSKQMFDETGDDFNGDDKKVNLNALKNLDDLVTWCVKYGVHACFDVSSTPGGSVIDHSPDPDRMTLFKEGSKEQKIFFNFWKLITKRYKDISTNALSYNLYNEPPEFVSDETWTKLMKKTIDLIHDEDPTRLLFVDMLEYANKPCYGLVGEKIVQSAHIYDTYEFTHANYDIRESIQRGASYKPATYDRDTIYPILQEKIKDLVDFRDKTGTTIMVQEVGCTNYHYMDSIVAYFDDLLSLLDENGVNWVYYAYDAESFGYVALMDCFRSEGGTYIRINPGRYVAKELRGVLHRHMKEKSYESAKSVRSVSVRKE